MMLCFSTIIIYFVFFFTRQVDHLPYLNINFKTIQEYTGEFQCQQLLAYFIFLNANTSYLPHNNCIINIAVVFIVTFEWIIVYLQEGIKFVIIHTLSSYINIGNDEQRKLRHHGTESA